MRAAEVPAGTRRAILAMAEAGTDPAAIADHQDVPRLAVDAVLRAAADGSLPPPTDEEVAGEESAPGAPAPERALMRPDLFRQALMRALLGSGGVARGEAMIAARDRLTQAAAVVALGRALVERLEAGGAEGALAFLRQQVGEAGLVMMSVEELP